MDEDEKGWIEADAWNLEDEDDEEEGGGDESGVSEGEDEDEDPGELDEMFVGLKDSEPEEEAEDDLIKEVLDDESSVAAPFLLQDLEAETASQDKRRSFVSSMKKSDWREKKGTFFELLIPHLAFVIRTGLSDIEHKFEAAFCALHMMYLLVAQVPLPLLLHEKDASENEDAEDCTSKTKTARKYPMLRHIGFTAYRVSSSKTSTNIDTPGIQTLFDVQQFDFRSSTASKNFSELRSLESRKKLSALKYASDKVLEALSSRLEERSDTQVIHKEILAEARKVVVEGRTTRTVKKALTKATVGVQKKKKRAGRRKSD